MSLYDDPKKWAELAARLHDEKTEVLARAKTQENLARRRRTRLPDPDDMEDDDDDDEDDADEIETRPLPDLSVTEDDGLPDFDEFDDDDPTDVRIPGMERPRGSTDEGLIPAPGECVAHLVDEDADQDSPAFAIPADCTEFVIGRARDCDLQVRVDGEISRRHARIVRRRDRFVIEDMDSRNGTLVNGELVESRKLFGGELIQVGLSRYRFLLLDG